MTGHVTRMPDERLPKRSSVRNRSQCGQNKCYKDIPPESWEHSTQNPAKWRGLIRNGLDDYEAKIVCEAERNRKERKTRAKGSSSE